MQSYKNKIYYLNSEGYSKDIRTLIDVDADYIAYHENIAMDRIQYSMNIYFAYHTTRPVDFTLSDTQDMKLVFDYHLYASTRDNLNLIMQLSKWFKICKHCYDTENDIRLFYNARNKCIAFDEKCGVFCYPYFGNDNEFDNEWCDYKKVKISYINDVFDEFEFEFKIINDVLIVNDFIYCCETDYLEVYDIVCSYEDELKKYKKILHIIHVNEQQIELYLDKSCNVINCKNNPPTIIFSNDKVYSTEENFLKKINYGTEENFQFGIYNNPIYIFNKKHC